MAMQFHLDSLQLLLVCWQWNATSLPLSPPSPAPPLVYPPPMSHGWRMERPLSPMEQHSLSHKLWWTGSPPHTRTCSPLRPGLQTSLESIRAKLATPLGHRTCRKLKSKVECTCIVYHMPHAMGGASLETVQQNNSTTENIMGVNLSASVSCSRLQPWALLFVGQHTLCIMGVEASCQHHSMITFTPSLAHCWLLYWTWVWCRECTS